MKKIADGTEGSEVRILSGAVAALIALAYHPFAQRCCGTKARDASLVRKR